MGKNVHVVITSERGKTRSFSISRLKLRTMFWLALLLVAGSSVGWGLSMENFSLRRTTAVLQRDLTATRQQNLAIRTKAASQEKRQKALLETALSELRQRSQVIESILSAVGVDISIQESQANAGGPYANLPDDSYENLTFKVDHYLATIQSVPLGVPVPGTITSRFGRRIDPINKRVAFHDGVDIKNRPGTRIRTTADGVVLEKGYTKGFGHFVMIDHGNGFRSRYLHMLKSLVKQGQKVRRGQVIGLLGNTGRSTGPHLHYAIKYHGKPVNPIRFMRIAKYIRQAAARKTASVAGH